METSITNEMISQQTICGDNESLELTTDTEYNLNYTKEKTELEKTQNKSGQERFILSTFHCRKWLALRLMLERG